MKTAVEQFWDELAWIKKEIPYEHQAKAILEAYKEAKEMEKEQIEDAYYGGASDEYNCCYSIKSYENYYKETYESKR